jgi:hypothetical protein
MAIIAVLPPAAKRLRLDTVMAFPFPPEFDR